MTVEDGRYAMLYDNDGRTRRVAVKWMCRAKINRIVSTSAEVRRQVLEQTWDHDYNLSNPLAKTSIGLKWHATLIRMDGRCAGAADGA